MQVKQFRLLQKKYGLCILGNLITDEATKTCYCFTLHLVLYEWQHLIFAITDHFVAPKKKITTGRHKEGNGL